MNKIKIIVNAIPLINIKTGIGRYIEGLYTELEKYDTFDIKFFDGKNLLKKLPEFKNQYIWDKLVKLFWKFPDNFSYILRLILHYKREINFKKFSKKNNIYHETGFFPFESPIKTVFTIYDVSLIKYPEFHPKERVMYFKKFFYKRLKQVKYILTISNFSKKEILSCIDFPEDKIIVTYLGYNRKIFRKYNNKETNLTLLKYKIKKPFFLFVGTNDPRKNINLIIKAASKINFPFYIIGWDGWGESLGSKNITTIGYVDDIELAHLYNNAVALILPSFYEGFGLPVLEAMACGCPVVVSNKASLPEVAGEAGIYLNDINNENELCSILTYLLNNDSYKIKKSEESIKQAENFSWEKTAKITAEVFKRL